MAITVEFKDTGALCYYRTTGGKTYPIGATLLIDTIYGDNKEVTVIANRFTNGASNLRPYGYFESRNPRSLNESVYTADELELMALQQEDQQARVEAGLCPYYCDDQNLTPDQMCPDCLAAYLEYESAELEKQREKFPEMFF